MCRDRNAAERRRAQQLKRQKDAVFAQKKLQFFNKETSFARAKNRNIMGYSRDISDAKVRALYTAGKGRKAKETAAKRFFGSKAKGIALQGGRSRTAGRNAYLKYLNTAAKVDSVMETTFGRNMAYAQQGATRRFLNQNAKARQKLGIPASYGASVMMPPRDRLGGALDMAQQGLAIAAPFIPGGQVYTAFNWQWSDKRLKENIEEVGISAQGYKIYEFNYIGGDVRFRGAMAQDVLKKNPMAVGIDQNYLTVDYSKIDVAMEVV